MPRNGSGTYTLPQSPFVAGTTISSSAVNSDFSDIASALTASLPRDGQVGMSGALKAPDGSVTAPTLSFNNETNTGFFRAGAGQLAVSVLGVQVGIFSASGFSGSSTPIGAVIDYAGPTAPANWLLCFGQTVSRTTYAALFTAIGTQFGAGDGINTFGVPDLRGRISAGKDNMGGVSSGRLTTPFFGSDPNNLAETGGAQSKTIVTVNLPPYTPVGSVGISDPGHAHNYNYPAAVLHQDGTQQFDVFFGAVANTTTTNTTGISASFNGSAQGGTSTPMGVLQPTMILNKIIYAGV